MAEAKIELTIGSVSFSGSGESDWLAQQLDKVLEAAPRLGSVQSASTEGATGGGSSTLSSPPTSETLASYIKSKGGESSQVVRFLATADWLKRRGATALTTAAVTKALSDNQQKRLGNPADCLNKNVAKGYCEKSGDGFYVTPEGLKSLGHTA